MAIVAQVDLAIESQDLTWRSFVARWCLWCTRKPSGSDLAGSRDLAISFDGALAGAIESYVVCCH